MQLVGSVEQGGVIVAPRTICHRQLGSLHLGGADLAPEGNHRVLGELILRSATPGNVHVDILSRRQNAVVIEASCAFCDAMNNTLIAREVLRDDVAVAFLDRSPVFKGHVLVVPRRHVVTLADLESDLVGPFFERVQRVSARMPAAIDCDGTFVAINNVVSQSVAHLHVHVVPRKRKDGLRGFFWPRVRYESDAEADEYARRLREALAQ